MWRFLGPRGPLTEPMSVRPSVARKVFIINRYLGIGRSNEKISKNEVHFFLRILLLGGPSPSSQLVHNPFNWSPNTVFFTDISVLVAQIKIK